MLSGIRKYFKQLFPSWKVGNIIIVLFCLLVYATFKQMQFYAVFCLLLLLYFFAPELIRKFIIFLREHFEKLPGDIIPKPLPEAITVEDSDIEETKDKDMETYVGVTKDAIELFKKGNMLLRQGLNEEAIKCYLQAIEKKDDYKDAFLNLGAAYMALWHEEPNPEYLQDSIDASKQALQLDTDGYRSRINLAVALSKKLENENEALIVLEEADKRGDLSDPLNWGKVKLFKGQLYYNKSLRSDDSPDIELLKKAEINVEESIKLFRTGSYDPSSRKWIYEAQELLSIIQKRIKIK